MFRPVVGYLDPGSGTLLLQLLLSAMCAVGYFFRNRVMSFFRGFFSRRPSGGTSADTAGFDAPTTADTPCRQDQRTTTEA